MFNRIFITALFLLFPVMLAAQVIEPDRVRTGSFYSSFGIGAPADVYSPYTTGMGFSGVSVLNQTSPSLGNPSHWGFLGITQAQISAGLTNFEASDANSTASNSLLAIESFQFSLPLMRERLGASVVFQPVTRSDFSRINTYSTSGDLFDPVDYGVNTIGTGGINKVEFGLGYKLFDNFSIGYAASVYLLTLREEAITAFSESQFRSNRMVETTTGNSVGHRFGATLWLQEAFRSNDQLIVGSTVNLPVSIETDRSIRTFRNVEGQQREVELNEQSPDRAGNVNFPLEFNFGITYYFNNLNSFTTELHYQNWDAAEYSYSPEREGFYSDRYKIGVGYQHHAYQRQQAQGFFSDLRYSLGASYDQGFLTISGNDIETYSFHAGVAVPSPTSRSSIDLSFNFGIRGTESENLVKENIWGFKLSLNLAEFMFIRSRFQ